MTEQLLSTDLRSEVALESFHSALLDDDPTALYERAPCGYLSTAPDGKIVKVNQTFLTLTGYERGELVGRRTFAELLTAGGRIYHETHYAPMLQMQGSAREIALDIVRADGSRLPALVNSVLERDEDGHPVVVRTAVFDATSRREYERELLRAKQRAERSEERAALLAHTLQQTLIPPTPPQIPGLEVAAAYRPAGSGDEVGGDFYDVFAIGDGRWIIAIGDVCGKGVGAAVITALARHTIRAAAVLHDRPSEILAILNQVLLGHESERFCTVALISVRSRNGTWTATVSCAGHPAPLLRSPGGRAHPVGRAGSLLGAFADPHLFDHDQALKPGDALLLYTDGLTEARGSSGFFGEARLAERFSGSDASVPSLVDALIAEVVEFQDGNPRDDIALVALAF